MLSMLITIESDYSNEKILNEALNNKSLKLIKDKELKETEDETDTTKITPINIDDEDDDETNHKKYVYKKGRTKGHWPVLFHKEGEDIFSQDGLENYPVSKILYGKVNWLLTALLDLPEECYLILPCYHNDKDEKEVQLAVTGKFKQGENSIEAIHREISEELGFNIRKECIKPVDIDDNINNLYYASVELTENNINKEIKTSNNNQGDDMNDHKIISWVYTNEIDAELFYNRKRLKSDDEAGKNIAVIPVKMMKRILTQLKKNQIVYCGKYLFYIGD